MAEQSSSPRRFWRNPSTWLALGVLAAACATLATAEFASTSAEPASQPLPGRAQWKRAAGVAGQLPHHWGKPSGSGMRGCSGPVAAPLRKPSGSGIRGCRGPRSRTTAASSVEAGSIGPVASSRSTCMEITAMPEQSSSPRRFWRNPITWLALGVLAAACATLATAEFAATSAEPASRWRGRIVRALR